MTIYKAPDWLYKSANIKQELYKPIQKELQQIFYYKFKDIPTNEIISHFVIPAPAEYIKSNCPNLMKQLKEYDLDSNLLCLAMIIVANGQDYPIHVDTLNPGYMTLGLNIPVLNCKDSYTAWYDTDILYHESFAVDILNAKGFSTAVPCNSNDAVEIDRCDANTPSWINVARPHNAICNHDKLRVNASLRFDKKIFEMINDGSFYTRCSI
jgi:hypothetical protein